MKKFLFIVLVLFVGMYLFGCQKKQQSLEEMQQPMSPEDLNRLSSQPSTITSTLTESNALPLSSTEAAPTGTIISTTGVAGVEQLPPSGPYKPSEKDIQVALKNAGYYFGAIDGKIGPQSKKAIEEFQKTNDLTVDGKVGPKTWAVLGRYLNQTAESAATTESGSSTDIKLETVR